MKVKESLGIELSSCKMGKNTIVSICDNNKSIFEKILLLLRKKV